jgi:hypothetical protein
MKRPRSHQIDELAQRRFRDAIPPTWVVNKQENDYGIDYHVQIGEDSADLTGIGFFVQLKGQENADLSANGMLVKYCLEIKYAAHYLDRIRDLPVFLVVVDVTTKKGWWLFLQSELEADQSWRQKTGKKPCTTVHLPISNDISETTSLSSAVEEAKKWMRLHHPESIHDAVVAHKERIARIDPRFDAKADLVGDHPFFTLMPKEDVVVSMNFKKTQETAKKAIDLLDNGVMVDFEPGEVTISGSGLFEQFEQTGGAMKVALALPTTITLICLDAEGKQLARINDMPGHLTGGRKQQWCGATFPGWPMTITIGPISVVGPGPTKINVSLDFKKWYGQHLLSLAYFDRFQQFFTAVSSSTSMSIICQHNGNTFLPLTWPIDGKGFFPEVADVLELIRKARQVARKLSVNPIWAIRDNDEDTLDTIEELYGIHFDGGWSSATPNVRITWKSESVPTHSEDALNGRRCPIRIISNLVYLFLGEKVMVKQVLRDYSDMTLNWKKRRRQITKRVSSKAITSSKVVYECMLAGSLQTMTQVRLATPQDAIGEPSMSMSGRVNFGSQAAGNGRRNGESSLKGQT